MAVKKSIEGRLEPRPINFSVRLSETDARRVRQLAEAHDWPTAKVLQKLISAALEARLVK
jgi:hypothetical protein